MPLFLFFNTQAMNMHCYVFPKNLIPTLAGFEPGSSVPEADVMSTAPRCQGNT
jgi:hypothetical protein